MILIKTGVRNQTKQMLHEFTYANWLVLCFKGYTEYVHLTFCIIIVLLLRVVRMFSNAFLEKARVILYWIDFAVALHLVLGNITFFLV